MHNNMYNIYIFYVGRKTKNINMKKPKIVLGNMYKLFPDFRFLVFVLIFKPVYQTHINNIKTCLETS
jgi:hypothetical protein